jgi:Zc3h12a-like Ribonuclease NYN domain
MDVFEYSASQQQHQTSESPVIADSAETSTVLRDLSIVECTEQAFAETLDALLAEYECQRNKHPSFGSVVRSTVGDNLEGGTRCVQTGRRRKKLSTKRFSPDIGFALGLSRPLTRTEQFALRMDYGASRNDICNTEETRLNVPRFNDWIPLEVHHDYPEGPVGLKINSPKNGGLDAVVVDGQNVACSFGGGRGSFCARGILLCLDYYRLRAIEAVAIVPQRRIDQRRHIANSKLADDPELLRQLSRSRRCFFSPSGSHDDYYIIEFAMQFNRKIVSNDKFREIPGLQACEANKRRVADFLNSNTIPFMFVGDHFLPAPDESRLGAVE